jgi:hypothetical protein
VNTTVLWTTGAPSRVLVSLALGDVGPPQVPLAGNACKVVCSAPSCRVTQFIPGDVMVVWSLVLVNVAWKQTTLDVLAMFGVHENVPVNGLRPLPAGTLKTAPPGVPTAGTVGNGVALIVAV